MLSRSCCCCCCPRHAQTDSAATDCPNTNFLKGVQWAPDGSCCLTASDDNRCVVCVFNTRACCVRLTSRQQQSHCVRQPGTSDAHSRWLCLLMSVCRLRVFDLPADAWPTQQQQQQQQAEVNAPQEAAGAATGSSASAAAWQPAVQVHAGETVYDCCWFSGMSASDPASCCFASTSRVSVIVVEGWCAGVTYTRMRERKAVAAAVVAYCIRHTQVRC